MTETDPASPADRPGDLFPDPRLSQIYQRDPQAEGRFWYSVVTTAVYCRPTCPSRRARPENIRLHTTLAEARATGFRPCRRCRPEEVSQIDRHLSLVAAVCRAMETDKTRPFRVLAQTLGVSPPHLYRIFRRVTGTTPLAYRRLQAERGATACFSLARDASS